MKNRYGRVAITILRRFFGRFWPIVLIVFAVLVFWPVVIFRSSVQFSPSTFVERWIQTGITSIFIFLAIEIARQRAINDSAREEKLRELTSECAEPAARMLEGLVLLGCSIRSGDLSEARKWTLLVTDAWQPLRTHLSPATANHSDSAIRARLSTLVDRHEVQKMDHFISSLGETNELSEFSQTEIEWLMNSVASISQKLTRIEIDA